MQGGSYITITPVEYRHARFVLSVGLSVVYSLLTRSLFKVEPQVFKDHLHRGAAATGHTKPGITAWPAEV